MNVKSKIFSLTWPVTAHVFVAGILMSFAVNFILGFIFGFVEEFTKEASGLEINLSIPQPVFILILMISFWFGVKYWAKYFNNKFEVNSNNFALISSSVLLVLLCLYDFLIKYNLMSLKNTPVIIGFILGVIFIDIIMILPFYFSTKKYIVNVVNKT